MYLFLDPRSPSEILVGTTDGSRKPRFFVYQRNDDISLLEFVLKKSRLTTDNLPLITGMVVVPGPGGFSNVRSAVTLANSLGFAAKIPVVAVRPKKTESNEQAFKRGLKLLIREKSHKNVKPIYNKPPNITFKKVEGGG